MTFAEVTNKMAFIAGRAFSATSKRHCWGRSAFWVTLKSGSSGRTGFMLVEPLPERNGLEGAHVAELFFFLPVGPIKPCRGNWGEQFGAPRSGSSGRTVVFCRSGRLSHSKRQNWSRPSAPSPASWVLRGGLWMLCASLCSESLVFLCCFVSSFFISRWCMLTSALVFCQCRSGAR